MPLTNEDIISGLVAFYKRSGVDMTALLGDPTFQSLKMVDKIQAIKDYAKDIYAGSSDDLTKAQKGQIAADAAWRGFFPLVAAVPAIGLTRSIPRLLPGVHGKTLLQVGLGGIAMGATFGALSGYLKARQAQEEKKALRSNLAAVVQDPSTTNAVGVLATNNLNEQNRGAVRALTNRAIDQFNDIDVAKSTIDNYKQFLPLFQKEKAFEMGRRYRPVKP